MEDGRAVALYNANITWQDELHPVRHRFMSKLLHFLVARRLPPLFNTIVFLTVHDPETEIPNMVHHGSHLMTMHLIAVIAGPPIRDDNAARSTRMLVDPALLLLWKCR
jgi:hypothetical protein